MKESKPKGMVGRVPVWCAFDELVPLDQLKGNPRNPNRHPVEQIQKLAEIIEAQGWRWPIKVSRRSGFIVSGHCRLAAAKRAKLKKAPVDYQDYESDEAETADLLADNKVQELSILDDDMADQLLRQLDAAGFDTGLTGFDFDPADGFVVADGSDGVGAGGGDSDKPEIEFSEELTESKNYLVLTFDNDIDWLQAQSLFEIKTVKAGNDKPGFIKRGIGRVIKGPEAINKILGHMR
jgi:hypothetical protein